MRARDRWDELAKEHGPPANGVFICRRRRPTARDTRSTCKRSTSARPEPRRRPYVRPMAAQGAPHRAADGIPRCGPSCACVDGGAQGSAGPPERDLCPRPPGKRCICGSPNGLLCQTALRRDAHEARHTDTGNGPRACTCVCEIPASWKWLRHPPRHD